ncbi:MAG: Replisome organizer region-containing protein [Nitrospirae bacterium]|nr:MAG: Replisome organizer region-containing protein [Nitrospirota bacterium]
MPEIKWIKITTDIFEDDKIDFIDSLPEKDTILILWVKLLTLAGKVNNRGLIYLTPEIPYTEEMLSHKFKRPINTVKLAIETFNRLGMIDILDNGHIAIPNWEKHQNLEGMEKVRQHTKNRVQKYRENQRLIDCNVTVTHCNTNVTQQNKNKNKNKELKDTHQPQKSDVQEFIDFYFQEYQKKFKIKPPFKGGRDGKTVKTLLKAMTVDILKTTVIRFLETEDLFFRKNGYDIPRFEKFLDGMKCGAYEAASSWIPESKPQDNVILDPSTGNPAQTLRPKATPRKELV